MKKDELIIKLLGKPENISLSGRILNLTLLVSFFVFLSASFINLFLGDVLLIIETTIGAALFATGYYISIFKGKTKVVAHLTAVLIIVLFISNWIMNQGSFGPTAFFIPHMTVIIYFLLYGRTRKSILSIFIVITSAAFLYEYANPEIISPYNDSVDRYIDLGMSSIQGIFFMIALLMYIQWNFNQEIISKQKIMEELKISRKEADTANVAKSMFLANMSHEMRTPLNAIIGFSHVLLDQHANEMHDEQKEYLQHIHQNGDYLMALINNVLDMSKIEANKMVLSLESFELKKSIHPVIASAQAHAKEKSLVFESSVSDVLPNVINSDRVKINQILTNLLSNAIKFTSHGLVSLSLKEKDGSLQIIVTDEGVGISSDKLHTIFKEFEQADISTTRKYGGFGLGLAITRKITTILNGEINVQSTLGKGTTFEVLLPLEEGDLDTDSTNVNQEKQITISPETKILLVEDNAINQKVMVAFLKKMGLTAQLAENGEIGLEMVDSFKPDIIFMDLHMPVMDGFEAVTQLRKRYSAEELPIIALTADAFQQQLDKTIEGGFNDRITKPITQAGLESILAQYL